MKQSHEILEKIRMMKARYLSEMKKVKLTKCVDNCFYHGSMKVHANGTLGYCSCPEVKAAGLAKKWPIVVCQDEEPPCKWSYYQNRNTPESVEMTFDKTVCNPSQCSDKYPKLAILLWCLDGKTDTRFVRFKNAVRYLLTGGWL